MPAVTGPIELYRCLSCHKLLTTRRIRKYGKCKCGGRRLCGASPVGILEKIKVRWWELRLTLGKDIE